MNIFIVNQNPTSNYNDEVGKRYDYPTSIPNGKMINAGDILIFNLSKKYSNKLNNKEKRLTGIAIVDTITLYKENRKQKAIASYSWYYGFKIPISFDEIGGDLRLNKTNSINKIKDDLKLTVLLNIIKIITI